MINIFFVIGVYFFILISFLMDNLFFLLPACILYFTQIIEGIWFAKTMKMVLNIKSMAEMEDLAEQMMQ